jgi:hypothetical protein
LHGLCTWRRQEYLRRIRKRRQECLFSQKTSVVGGACFLHAKEEAELALIQSGFEPLYLQPPVFTEPKNFKNEEP